MKARSLSAIVVLLIPVVAWAQNPKGATYITDEQVKLVNSSPGVDRQIVNVDIVKSNLAVGVIHRGRSGAPPAAGATPAVAAAPAAAPVPCGEKSAAPPAPGSASGIAHDGQTETTSSSPEEARSSPVDALSTAAAPRLRARSLER